MIHTTLIAFIIPLAGVLFEVYPRLLNRKFGVDIWTHLLYLKEYHRQKRLPMRIESGFLLPGEYDYPPAFIFILSKFPFKLVERYEFLFSPFFDYLHMVIIFIFAYLITHNILIAIVTQVLYILTPIIILENSNATPRSLGYTLFTILFVSLFFFQQQGNILFLIIAILAGVSIFLSHRFTTQGFLFFSIFFSLLDKNILYISIFIFSLVIAIVISRGFYIRVFLGHIGNLMFWYKNIDYRFAHQVKGNVADSEYDKHDFILKIYNKFLKFPPFVLAITNPWTLPVFFSLKFAMPEEPILQKFVWWVFFSYILALATIWFKKFRFLGEGQRYLELAAFPAALLSARLFIELLVDKTSAQLAVFYYIVVSIAAFITIVIIQRKGIVNDKLRTVTPQMEKMFTYLKHMKKKPHLLCIPHQITTSTIYHTDSPVFVNASYKDIEQISEVYPYIREPIEKICKKYNLDSILLNSDYASIKDLKIKKYRVLRKIGNWFLIRLNF